jgi:hypothetical protein
MKIWIASFIPRTIAGLTRPLGDGSGRTAIPGPTLISDCFLTDQREFDPSPTASSRTRLVVDVDVNSMQILNWSAHCDSTTEIDCEDGEVECEKTPDSSKLKVINVSSAAGILRFTFSGGAGNPCALGAPDIDWLVHVEVTKSAPTSIKVAIGVGSVVEPFPAFEMYASTSGGTKALFRRPPDAGADPWNLIGAPNKVVSGSATFP